jgi:hypothetical protein
MPSLLPVSQASEQEDAAQRWQLPASNNRASASAE